jgi:SAM-dependent methyltransferase
MGSAVSERLPHAALDGGGRLPKAEKIARLLALALPEGRTLRILEVGTGSGVIAQDFARRLGARAEVDAVDVADQRVVHDGYRFRRVDGTTLPFASGTFDAVISNHVIEHVGERDDQLAHVRELARVLREDGRGYLAVPSRWQPVEPHYRLAFLSWLPKPLRSPYLRWRGRGDFYDCEPLRLFEIEAYFRAAGLASRNVFVPALRALVDAEGGAPSSARIAAAIPDRMLHAVRALSPTHVYLFAHTPEALGDG